MRIISCMKLTMIFLLYNNLFIYQVRCTLIYRRRSLYSFLSGYPTKPKLLPFAIWVLSCIYLVQMVNLRHIPYSNDTFMIHFMHVNSNLFHCFCIYRQYVESGVMQYIPRALVYAMFCGYPDSKVHGANMGSTWVLSAPDGPHVGPMNLAIG